MDEFYQRTWFRQAFDVMVSEIYFLLWDRSYVDLYKHVERAWTACLNIPF